MVTEKTVERVGTAGSSNLSSSVATNSPLSFKLQNNPDLDLATSSAKQVGTHKSRAVPRNQPTARRGDSNSGDAAGPDWKHRTGEHVCAFEYYLVQIASHSNAIYMLLKYGSYTKD